MSSNVIMVFSENPELLQELINGARQQATALGWKIAALGLGKDVSALANLGEDVLFQIDIDARNPELVTSAMATAVTQTQPSVCLIGATKLGLEVAPRMAERIGAGYAAWMTNFEVAMRADCVITTAQCMVYAGAGVATYKFKPGTVVLSVASGIFESGLAEGKKADVVALHAQILPPKMTIQEYKPKSAGRTRLGEARLVVDIGQGVKQREDLQMIQALAELLDGQLACSRPIASDRDWFPEWVGLSGAKIKPELCLTVGVSGAIQHILGIRDSRLIAAVNIDEGAPIFSQADYCVVADLYEFLPALMERVKARGIRPAWMP
jgi:electron transfer flavoprotein alpha subunit